MSNQLTRYATVATVDTAGEGYFFGVSIALEDFDAGTIINSTDQVIAWQFVLPFRAVVRQITSEITTGGGASKLYGVGLYDIAGNRLLHTGALDANTTQILTTAITAVTLEPGIYWQAQTSDSATTAMRTNPWGTLEQSLLNDSGAILTGKGANASSAGVLPATLGAVTAATVRKAAAVLFLP